MSALILALLAFTAEPSVPISTVVTLSSLPSTREAKASAGKTRLRCLQDPRGEAHPVSEQERRGVSGCYLAPKKRPHGQSPCRCC